MCRWKPIWVFTHRSKREFATVPFEHKLKRRLRNRSFELAHPIWTYIYRCKRIWIFMYRSEREFATVLVHKNQGYYKIVALSLHIVYRRASVMKLAIRIERRCMFFFEKKKTFFFENIIWSHTNTCIVIYGFYVDNAVLVYISVCLHPSVQVCVIIQKHLWSHQQHWMFMFLRTNKYVDNDYFYVNSDFLHFSHTHFSCIVKK